MLRSALCIQHTWSRLERCSRLGRDSRSVVKLICSLSLASHHKSHYCSTTVLSSHSTSASAVPKPNIKYSIPSSMVGSEMDSSSLFPPPGVRGMTELNLEAFTKKILVPHVIVNSSKVNSALKHLKKYLLKFDKLKPVNSDDHDPEKRVILLNPALVKSLENIQAELTEICASDKATCDYREVTLTYENWKVDDILKAILPDDQEGVQSYSIVGHILHLNLRDHVLPYKTIIGQVFLDKIPNITLVVNKVNTIDSTYRNFQMEVLGGSGDTLVTVKENGCSYSMDFAKVYWNPRLSTEHERVVKKLRHGDVLYDVMAGVGPFAIPAGRKKCSVLANDLNPDSFDALLKNCSINKVKDRVKCFNNDGHEFIKTVLKTDLLERWKDQDFIGSVHITMNLPALAVEFLPTFQGLFSGVTVPESPTLPIIHVYMFTKEASKDIAIGEVAKKLGYLAKAERETVSGHETEESVASSGGTEDEGGKLKLQNSFKNLQHHIQEVIHVRQVAPNKAMMRVSFVLPLEVLTADPDTQTQGPPSKKVKTS